MDNYEIEETKQFFDGDELIKQMQLYNIEQNKRVIVHTNIDMKLEDIKKWLKIWDDTSGIAFDT